MEYLGSFPSKSLRRIWAIVTGDSVIWSWLRSVKIRLQTAMCLFM